jgi:hypothetical protein
MRPFRADASRILRANKSSAAADIAPLASLRGVLVLVLAWGTSKFANPCKSLAMNVAVWLEDNERFDVHFSAIETPRFNCDGRREFAHGGVKRIHAHRTLCRFTRRREFAGRTTIPRDRECVHIVLVCAQIKLAKMSERSVVAAIDERLCAREFRPHAMWQRINWSQCRVALEQRARNNFIAAIACASQRDFNEVRLIWVRLAKSGNRRVIKCDRRHRWRWPVARFQVESL